MATKAEKLLAKGQALDLKGKRQKALELYREACQAEPYDPDPWTLRSNLARALGHAGEAAEALFHVCELFARSGMTDDAHATARKVLEIDPGHGGARRLARMFEARAAAKELPLPPPEPPPPPVVVEAPPPPVAVIETPPVVDDPPKSRKTMMVPVVPMPVAPKRGQEAWTDPKAKEELPLAAAVAATARPAVEESSDFTFDPTDRGLEDLSLVDHLHAQGDGGEVTLDEQKIDVLQAVASTISTSPLLSELDSDLVRHLIEAGRLQAWGGMDVVFRQGEIGTSLYLVLQGEVAVEREEPDREPRELARLRAGAFFGEMALLTNMPRSATVRATKPVYLLEVSRAAIRELVGRDRRVLKLLMRFFRARLVGTHLQTSELFRRFSREEKRRLISRFRLREVPADQVVLAEAQRGEGLFLVLVGRLEVTQSAATAGPAGARRVRATTQGEAIVLGELGPGDVFGEMSLLEGTQTMATVRTTSRAWVLFLPATEFHELAEQHPSVRDHLVAVAAARRAQNRQAVTDALREDRVEPV